jgi:hypothetical protein
MPVLPLEKTIVAAELAGTWPPFRRRSRATGSRRAASSARIFANVVMSLRRSSRKTMPGISARPAFDRNVFDVMIVLMPACAMATDMVSAPIVKFRLTGTCPAMSTAMLARAPPTEAGSSRPTISCPSVRRRMAWPSSIDPTSARPNVSVCPVLSAMPSRRHRRLATRMNEVCSRSDAGRRWVMASAPSSIRARRASRAVMVDGNGWPNATVTG